MSAASVRTSGRRDSFPVFPHSRRKKGRIRFPLADHQIIKEHLDGSQVLLDRLRRAGMFLHIGRNKHGSNRPDVINVIF